MKMKIRTIVKSICVVIAAILTLFTSSLLDSSVYYKYYYFPLLIFAFAVLPSGIEALYLIKTAKKIRTEERKILEEAKSVPTQKAQENAEKLIAHFSKFIKNK